MTRLTTAQLAQVTRENPDIVVVGDGTTYNGAKPYMPPEPRRAATWTEHDFQAAVIAECEKRAQHDACYSMIFAIPNGGARSKAIAGRLKAEGVRAGVPDLFLAVPSGPYAGMFIELKISPNKPSRVQLEWIQRLRQRAYRVAVVWDSVDAVMSAIEEYLEEL